VPLHYAAESVNDFMVDVLIGYGADAKRG